MMTTLPSASMLTGLSMMLNELSIHVDELEIARQMEAPYLFVFENDQYNTGAGLYQPKWINLYLNNLGLHMSEQAIPLEESFTYLRSISNVMLRLRISKEHRHLVIYTGYHDGRYHFLNIKRAASSEPHSFAFSRTMLKRRLDDSVHIFQLDRCTPVSTDYIPLLFQSLKTLASYHAEILAALQRTVTKTELSALNAKLFRALMQDAMPMMALIGDMTLAEELRLLNHDHRHIFTCNSPDRVPLCERLPRSSITNCITWIHENIVDRLYELGATDEDIFAGLSAV